jgi:hypothetical protein
MINQRTAFATVLPVMMEGHEHTRATFRVLDRHENADHKYTRKSSVPGTLSSSA